MAICRITSEHSSNRVEFASLPKVLESDAKRLRLDAGKPAILMLPHDVSFGSECCKPVTVLKLCDDSGERAYVFLTRRAASTEVQYDVLTKPQQGCFDARSDS